jgi:hypothetical protein
MSKWHQPFIMTLKGHKNHYNVKLLRGYGASIALKNQKIFLKNGKNVFNWPSRSGGMVCHTNSLSSSVITRSDARFDSSNIESE